MPPRPIVAGLKEAPPTIGIGLCLFMMLVNEVPVRFIFLPEDDWPGVGNEAIFTRWSLLRNSSFSF